MADQRVEDAVAGSRVESGSVRQFLERDALYAAVCNKIEKSYRSIQKLRATRGGLGGFGHFLSHYENKISITCIMRKLRIQ
ncbi:hypothetical protein D3C71_2069530 [compost metagenome]